MIWMFFIYNFMTIVAVCYGYAKTDYRLMGSFCLNFIVGCFIHIYYCLSYFKSGKFYYNHQFYFHSIIPLKPLSDYPLTFGINKLSLCFIFLLLLLFGYSVISSIIFNQYKARYERFRTGIIYGNPGNCYGPQLMLMRPADIRQHFRDLIAYLMVTFFLLIIFCSIDVVAVIMVYRPYVLVFMFILHPTAFLVDRYYLENKYRMYYVLFLCYVLVRTDISQIVFC